MTGLKVVIILTPQKAAVVTRAAVCTSKIIPLGLLSYHSRDALRAVLAMVRCNSA